MARATMTKAQLKKFEAITKAFATVNGVDEEVLKEEANNLYGDEDHYYEGQAVLNFFKARIQPKIENKEFPVDFDKRYREWRVRICEECEEEFAYAFAYDGVKFCSLECLDAALHKIGMKVTRGRDSKKRWGVFFRPAIVPSSAFEALKTLYPDAFSEPSAPDDSNLQQLPTDQIQEPKQDIENE